MIIPDALQIKQLDAATVVAQNFRSSDLMERAAKGITNYLLHDNPHFEFFIINCGTGNNGGDGLCIARQLLQAGKNVKVNICGDVHKSSADFALNFQRLQTQFPLVIHIITNENSIPSFDCDCLIDCLFGTGLNKPITGFPALIIEKMNMADAIILAVDIPSGLQSNTLSVEPIVKADCTISFEFPKLVFLFPENAKYVGQWMIQNIGLIDTKSAGLHQHLHFLTADDIQPLFSERQIFAHKGSFGHVLTIGGSPGMEGAAAMSGLAALKTGAGLSTITATNLTVEHPEMMYTGFDNIISTISSKKINAVSIGPGLGNTISTFQILSELFQAYRQPIVVDADALNCISEHPELLNKIPPNAILTPHPKEFERLFGSYQHWFELPNMMIQLAQKYQVIILYKRAYTLIACPDGNVYFNSTGNAGMATAGSGDVLTGIISGLLAQGFTPKEAALAGVYMHGLSGDLALENNNNSNLIATDIIHQIPLAKAIIMGTE